jgi:hypothetical protein
MALAFSWACALAVGCGSSSSDLSRGSVTSIPAGDATGTTASGSYHLDVLTQACAGDCSYTVGGSRSSVCDVGVRQSATITVTQADGRLQVDAEDQTLYVSRLIGGVYRDGRFEVGGYATQGAGAVEILERVTGTVSAQGQLTATAEVAGHGAVGSDSISCTGTFAISGAR